MPGYEGYSSGMMKSKLKMRDVLIFILKGDDLMARKRKFHNYLINRGMQLRITLKYLAVTILSSLLTGFVVYVTIWPAVQDFVPYALVNRLRDQVFFRLLYGSFPLILFITVCCIVITHRIAGPLYNMENKIDKLIQGGDVEIIVTRKNDDLKELTEKVNELILMLKECKEQFINPN